MPVIIWLETDDSVSKFRGPHDKVQDKLDEIEDEGGTLLAHTTTHDEEDGDLDALNTLADVFPDKDTDELLGLIADTPDSQSAWEDPEDYEVEEEDEDPE